MKKLLIIRIVSVVVTALGLITLACGLILRFLNEDQRYAADGAQMPEEYIEEFFADEGGEYDIEDYLPPAYDE